MKTLIWNALDTQQKAAALQRPALLDTANVSAILKNVRDNGDAAVREYTQKFDGVTIRNIKIPTRELETAWNSLSPDDKAAMQTAKANIEAFHRAQIPQALTLETMPGVVCKLLPRAIDSVGLYVPGGTAPLVSTVMMLAIPAQIANVPQCVMTTPPQADGDIAVPLKAAAYLCGIQSVYKVGGAQAIAALAYGTQSIPKVAKIFGPGNAYVAAAKAAVSMKMGGPAIDLPAGPSEVMVLADEMADPVFTAADLLAQAEHDTLAQTICICLSENYAERLNREITKQMLDLPRQNTAQQALKHGRILIADSIDAMLSIANAYAPEHLIVQTENPEHILPLIRNAGSVFLGKWTPESVGDYASGTNHTLPTFGAARAYSGLNLASFMKFMSVQSLTRQGLENLAPTVERLAQMEGLEAHRRAVSLRLQTETPSCA